VPAEGPVWISLRGAKLRSRRALDDMLFARFPPLYRAAARLVWRLRPGSRLRNAVFARTATHSLAAWSRQDFAFGATRYARDSILHIERADGRALLDIDTVYRGREGARQFTERWHGAWERIRFDPHWLVDCGGGLVLLLHRVAGRGRTSGLELEDEVGHVLRFDGGLIAEEHAWLGSWDPALRAVHLDRSDVPAQGDH
jgi:ketosteroid isomerase-like protein